MFLVLHKLKESFVFLNIEEIIQVGEWIHMNDDELDNSERSLFGVVIELIALTCKMAMLLIGSIFGILASLGMLYICIKLLA